ncbi:AGAP006457-PA [Anopheles gambiae str. PEST]|uniref:AGAP006457-PA n=1 Tax=Anopheles gambiae TaxID=7165 RepID=Q5TQX8_ANOGA|nr:AGAP006457-PA [Anopheles gambiae str. PEST]
MSCTFSQQMANSSCLTWLNFREHMLNTFCGIYRTQQHTDCRLIVPDGELYANRPILCMASSFLETILDGLPTIGADMVTIVIPDLTLATLRAVLQFIYTGEASVRSDEMASFVEACSFLQLRGVRFIANQIVGIRFGKTVGMVSEELIPASEGLEETACPREELFVAQVEDQAEEDEEEEEQTEMPITQSQVQPVECFIPESSESVQEHVESNEIVQVVLNIPSDATPACERETSQCVEIPQERLTQAIEAIIKDHESYEITSVPCAIDTTVPTPSETNTTNRPPFEDELEQANPEPPLSDPASYDARLALAMDAILHHGISYRIAARQYSIAKTVLWRKAMKMPRPVRAGSPKLSAQRREAIDALKTGEKLAHVSRRFEIPLSTLHREKQRLYSKGALPSNVSLKLRGKDESVRKRLQEAVGDCVAGRMSLSEAARTYGLPKTSIWRRVRSLQTSGCSSSGMNEENSASDAMAERPNQSEEAEVEEEEEEEDDDAKLTMGGILLRGSDTLQVGAGYMSDENISASDLAQLRYQLTSNYDDHVLNDSL